MGFLRPHLLQASAWKLTIPQLIHPLPVGQRLDSVHAMFLCPDMERETLATYPHVVVRIACRNCKRRGRYRLARLAERYGADMSLEALLRTVTANCHVASDRTGKSGCRGAYFPDLPAEDRRREPLRVIAGGRRPDKA